MGTLHNFPPVYESTESYCCHFSIGMGIHFKVLPYFFGYKTEFFSFQNNPKVLDPSYKTDLELWHCLGRVELVL